MLAKSSTIDIWQSPNLNSCNFKYYNHICILYSYTYTADSGYTNKIRLFNLLSYNPHKMVKHTQTVCFTILWAWCFKD